MTFFNKNLAIINTFLYLLNIGYAENVTDTSNNKELVNATDLISVVQNVNQNMSEAIKQLKEEITQIINEIKNNSDYKNNESKDKLFAEVDNIVTSIGTLSEMFHSIDQNISAVSDIIKSISKSFETIEDCKLSEKHYAKFKAVFSNIKQNIINILNNIKL